MLIDWGEERSIYNNKICNLDGNKPLTPFESGTSPPRFLQVDGRLFSSSKVGQYGDFTKTEHCASYQILRCWMYNVINIKIYSVWDMFTVPFFLPRLRESSKFVNLFVPSIFCCLAFEYMIMTTLWQTICNEL